MNTRLELSLHWCESVNIPMENRNPTADNFHAKFTKEFNNIPLMTPAANNYILTTGEIEDKFANIAIHVVYFDPINDLQIIICTYIVELAVINKYVGYFEKAGWKQEETIEVVEDDTEQLHL